jgi:hypothetical protein
MSDSGFPRSFSRDSKNNNDVFGQLSASGSGRLFKRSEGTSDDHFQFPVNLGNDEYRSFVLFNIYTGSSQTISNVDTLGTLGLGAGGALAGKALTKKILGRFGIFGLVLGGLGGLAAATNVFGQTPETVDDRNTRGNLPSNIRSTRINPPNQRAKETVALYMPQKLSVPHLLDYESLNLRGTNALDTVGGADLGTKAELLAFLGGEKLINAAGSLGSALLGDDVQLNAGVRAELRLAQNNMKNMMFNGVNQRRFEFTYEFAPKDREESEIIHDIIKLFKYYAYPKVSDFAGGIYFEMPAEFVIEYYEIDKSGAVSENKFLNRIAPCVLTQITVDYSPQGVPSLHADGSPTLINVSLDFMEVETITQEHVKEGY